MTHTLEIVDMSGQRALASPARRKVMKSRSIVQDGDGNEIGQIVQQNVIGKIRFALEAGGQQLGEIKAENWRAWNFASSTTTGTEVARITKTWEGLAKTLFTTADNYVVQIHRPLEEPLRSLVVAAALAWTPPSSRTRAGSRRRTARPVTGTGRRLDRSAQSQRPPGCEVPQSLSAN